MASCEAHPIPGSRIKMAWTRLVIQPIVAATVPSPEMFHGQRLANPITGLGRGKWGHSKRSEQVAEFPEKADQQNHRGQDEARFMPQVQPATHFPLSSGS